jgi:hypothetical protein
MGILKNQMEYLKGTKECNVSLSAFRCQAKTKQTPQYTHDRTPTHLDVVKATELP